MKSKIKASDVFNLVVMVCAVALLIYFCVSENGLVDLAKNIMHFRIRWLVVAVLSTVCMWCLDSLILFIFVKKGNEKYTYKNSFKVGMLGQFFSAITPFATGGQPMQAYVMAKQGVDAPTAIAALLQKFIIYQTTLALYSLVLIILRLNLFWTETKELMVMAVLGFLVQAAIIVALLVFSRSPKLMHKILSVIFNFLGKLHIIKNPQEKTKNIENNLIDFDNANKKFRKNIRVKVLVYFLSFLQITTVLIVPYFIYLSFGMKDANSVSPLDMIAGNGYVTMISSYVPLPGASGASEGSFYIFFKMFFTPETIKPAILLWRISTYYIAIFVGAPFAYIGKKQRAVTKVKEENLLSGNETTNIIE